MGGEMMSLDNFISAICKIVAHFLGKSALFSNKFVILQTVSVNA